jgi:hypothetical protein
MDAEALHRLRFDALRRIGSVKQDNSETSHE